MALAFSTLAVQEYAGFRDKDFDEDEITVSESQETESRGIEMSEGAKRALALCFLTGPVCGAFLIYFTSYVAANTAVCAPVAAVTTPFTNGDHGENFAYCFGK